jgi:hypothetical protein
VRAGDSGTIAAKLRVSPDAEPETKLAVAAIVNYVNPKNEALSASAPTELVVISSGARAAEEPAGRTMMSQAVQTLGMESPLFWLVVLTLILTIVNFAYQFVRDREVQHEPAVRPVVRYGSHYGSYNGDKPSSGEKKHAFSGNFSGNGANPVHPPGAPGKQGANGSSEE